ncbi:antibiotic biosynthesis monooxygenase [uncultured Sulfitobacter sp.]|uniref:putative quinol monooxygenase n=1 Tax=uncultured Sulfitobacter sp. TaxID=191468 RepID=UPI00261F99DD|nr:antibiotic biosynthesis monooxygenase [uncultured Sulfitobacter sp.]
MGVTLTGQLICKTEDEAARVRAALDTHIRLTRAEPGCLSFEVNPTDDPLVWQVDEAFADKAAFDAHQTRAGASDWAVQTAGIERNYTITGLA